MNNLVQFYYNKYLFKCTQDKFNNSIKSILTEIIFHHSQSNIKTLRTPNYYDAACCIICLHRTRFCDNFIICCDCCKICLTNDITIEFNISPHSFCNICCKDGYLMTYNDLYKNSLQNLYGIIMMKKKMSS